MEEQHLIGRSYCRVNGHSYVYQEDSLGTYPDGTPTMYEVYICSVCDKENYEPVAD